MASVPRNVSDWLATPAPFNTDKHGERARFSRDNSVVERRRPGDIAADCVCYTAHPLPLGQVWQITLLNTTSGLFGLAVGVTTIIFDRVPRFLPPSGGFGDAGLHEWNYRGRTLSHNRLSTEFPRLPSLHELSTHQTVGLFISTNGQLHLFIDGHHLKCIATGLPVNKPLFGAVDVYARCTKIKCEILSATPEYILQAALDEGFIPHKDDKFLFHGPGGVGKSSLISMFLGKQRALIRVSTAVAEQPLHMTPARDVTNERFTADWKIVDYSRHSLMIAHTSNVLYQSSKGREVGENEEGEGEEERMGEVELGLQSSSPESQSLTVHRPVKKADISNIKSHFFSKLFKVFKRSSSEKHQVFQPPPSLTLTLEVDPDNLKELFSDFLDGLHDKIKISQEIGELLMSHSIRIIDSGGQPQFHDIVSIFLSHISGFISVYKLSECLSAHGEVAFFNLAGVLTNEPYESHYSHDQVIRHELLAIQSEASRSGIEEMPNLAFVGTFRDQQHTCPETPEEKDEQLHSIITEILPEEMHECVITNGGSLKQASFRVNARTPEPRDFQSVEQLKLGLMSRSRAPTRKLPLKWHGLEVAFHMLMQELGHQCLSRGECEFIGHKLGFDYASLNAALNYLRQLNIISFYDVLPNVVFGSSQVILDKITELVTYSLELKKGECGGEERRFLHQGIISLEFLQSKALSKHYTHNLFGPEDLLQVFTSLLVVTKVGDNEYLVPCVLEVSSIYPSPPLPKGNMRSSFILQFSKKSPMFGVYGCTISSLMSDAGWKLLIEEGEAVQVARNSTTFKMPASIPGNVTLLDPLSSYLEVVIQLPLLFASRHSKTLYPKIRDAIFTAVKKAMKTLHYKVYTPDLTFLCPEQSSRCPQCSNRPHPSTLMEDRSILVCSLKHSSVCHPVTGEQRKWLPKAGFFSWLKGLGKRQTTPALPPPPHSPDESQLTSEPSATAPEDHHVITGSEHQDYKIPKNQAAAPLPLTVSGDCTVPSCGSKKLATAAPALTISGVRPTLPELLKLNILQWVGNKYDLFGTFLLNDETGGEMAIIKNDCRGEARKITITILSDWLQGKGTSVSWESLIETFRNCDLSYRADQIQMALDPPTKSTRL